MYVYQRQGHMICKKTIICLRGLPAAYAATTAHLGYVLHLIRNSNKTHVVCATHYQSKEQIQKILEIQIYVLSPTNSQKGQR